MVSSLLEVQNMASIEKLPSFLTVGTTTARTAPDSSVSIVTDAQGMAKNGVDTVEMLMFPYLFPQSRFGLYLLMAHNPQAQCLHHILAYFISPPFQTDATAGATLYHASSRLTQGLKTGCSQAVRCHVLTPHDCFILRVRLTRDMPCLQAVLACDCPACGGMPC